MPLLNIYELDVSTEFRDFLTEIKTNVEAYSEAKHKAQKERMIIIGKIAEYKQSFPQRSTDHRLLVKAMKEEGWSEDVISNNLTAFRKYQNLMSGHSDWHPLAQAASVSQLLVMERAEGEGQLFYYLCKYFKRNKKLPSVSSMRGYLSGWFTEDFVPIRRGTLIKDSATAEEVGILEKPSVIHDEFMEDNQAVLREKLLKILSELNMDKAFINSEFKEKLESHNHQLEVLADWSKPERIKPTYL